MLELDVMLRRYLDQQYEGLDAPLKVRFVEFLQREDDQLWDWLSGRIIPEDPANRKLVEQIRQPA
ncbi:MAG: succinate dehydrogenase assembly factor 2 [Lysobacterales bacterium]